MLATIAVLEGQLARYEDLPRDVGSLDALFRDPGMADVSEFFLRLPNGAIQFQKRKYKASLLAEIVAEDPGYLEWMLGTDFMDDTKQIIRNALQSNSQRSTKPKEPDSVGVHRPGERPVMISPEE